MMILSLRNQIIIIISISNIRHRQTESALIELRTEKVLRALRKLIIKD